MLYGCCFFVFFLIDDVDLIFFGRHFYTYATVTLLLQGFFPVVIAGCYGESW